MVARWAAVTEDGVLNRGRGWDGVHVAMAEADAALLMLRGQRPVYIRGPVNMLSTVEVDIRGNQTRAWGIRPREGDRVWFLPGGNIGIGKSVEDVEQAIEILGAAHDRPN